MYASRTFRTRIAFDPFSFEVGLVEMAQTDEGQGVIAFKRIVDAVKLNADKDFEYRGFVLHIRRMSAETRSSMSGQSYRSLSEVTCEIVGRVAP